MRKEFTNRYTWVVLAIIIGSFVVYWNSGQSWVLTIALSLAVIYALDCARSWKRTRRAANFIGLWLDRLWLPVLLGMSAYYSLTDPNWLYGFLFGVSLMYCVHRAIDLLDARWRAKAAREAAQRRRDAFDNFGDFDA